MLLRNQQRTLPLRQAAPAGLRRRQQRRQHRQPGRRLDAHLAGRLDQRHPGQPRSSTASASDADARVVYSETASDAGPAGAAGVVVVGRDAVRRGLRRRRRARSGPTTPVTTTCRGRRRPWSSPTPTRRRSRPSARRPRRCTVARGLRPADDHPAGAAARRPTRWSPPGCPAARARASRTCCSARRPFTGRLPVTWPRTVAQEPINVGDADYDPLYPYGFGLRTCGTRARPRRPPRQRHVGHTEGHGASLPRRGRAPDASSPRPSSVRGMAVLRFSGPVLPDGEAARPLRRRRPGHLRAGRGRRDGRRAAGSCRGWSTPTATSASTTTGRSDDATTEQQAIEDRDAGALLMRDCGSPVGHPVGPRARGPAAADPRAGDTSPAPSATSATTPTRSSPPSCRRTSPRRPRRGDGWVKLVGDWISRDDGDLAPSFPARGVRRGDRDRPRARRQGDRALLRPRRPVRAARGRHRLHRARHRPRRAPARR